jgi:tagatose-1,6-bisphosphate aldolase non-catalytic subunit AgaZ/GatZ
MIVPKHSRCLLHCQSVLQSSLKHIPPTTSLHRPFSGPDCFVFQGQNVSVRTQNSSNVILNHPFGNSLHRGDEDEVRRDLTYGYSDRCRYYWNQPAVQEEIARLFDNLGERPIPLTLVSQCSVKQPA